MAVRNASGERLPLIVVDTGGTFNKRYQPVDGALRVEEGARAARAILESTADNLELTWLQPVCKDSLEMTDTDRREVVAALATALDRVPDASVLVIHGTDTMHLTAESLAEAFPATRLVLTGAMRPYEIDPVEPALNIGLALGFLQATPPAGVYLAMSGRVLPLGRLEKDRGEGVFRPV